MTKNFKYWNKKILIPNVHERPAQAALISIACLEVSIIKATTVKGLRQLHRKSDILIHPCPNEAFQEFVKWLHAQLINDSDISILPINEAVVYACEKLRLINTEISERFIMPSHNSLNFSLSKYNATKAAIEAGITTPDTIFLKAAHTEKIEMPKKSLEFPLILKWDNILHDDEYSEGGLLVVENRFEMEDAIMELLPSNCSIILQKIVPGHGVGSFFLRQKGKIVLSFAHKRIHEVPWTGGVSAYCESNQDQEIIVAGERLLNAIDYDGVAMVEFRKEKGKPPVFLEINGRLWGSLGLALNAGVDFPKAMIEYHFHRNFTVLQPLLKHKLRWYEPSFELLYLKSLWSQKDFIKKVDPPKILGIVQVVFNFLNPFVRSDWIKQENPIQTSKRYLGLLKGELGNLKRNIIKNQSNKKPEYLVNSAVKRTSYLLKENIDFKNILFLCYGNICRSPFAEVKWENIREEFSNLPKAFSAGFHDNSNRATPLRFQSISKYLSVDLVDHRSKRVTNTMVNNADLVVVMDSRNLKDVKREFPSAIAKTIMLGAISKRNKPLEIEDPFGKKIGIGGKVYRRICEELDQLKEILVNK